MVMLRDPACQAIIRPALSLRWVIEQIAEVTAGSAFSGSNWPASAYVSALAAPRAFTMGQAVYALLLDDPPFGTDAMIIVRALWELVVNCEYILEDVQHREERSLRFLADYVASQRRRIELTKAFGEPETELPPEAVESYNGNARKMELLIRDHLRSRGAKDVETQAAALLGEWTKKPGRWSKATLEQRAKQVKRHRGARGVEYETFYRFNSEFAHSEVASLMPISPVFELAIGHPSYHHAGEIWPAMQAAVIASTLLLHFYELVGDVFELGWGDRLHALFEAAMSQWSKAGAVT